MIRRRGMGLVVSDVGVDSGARVTPGFSPVAASGQGGYGGDPSLLFVGPQQDTGAFVGPVQPQGPVLPGLPSNAPTVPYGPLGSSTGCAEGMVVIDAAGDCGPANPVASSGISTAAVVVAVAVGFAIMLLMGGR